MMKKIQGGWTDFDVCIAAPDMMGLVGRLASALAERDVVLYIEKHVHPDAAQTICENTIKHFAAREPTLHSKLLEVQKNALHLRDAGGIRVMTLPKTIDNDVAATDVTFGFDTAMNIATVTVTRRPDIALLATGNELVMPGEVPNDDQIIASNGFGLKALLEDAGATVRLLPIARDTNASLRAMASQIASRVFSVAQTPA